MEAKQRFSIGYLIAVVLALVMIQSLFFGPHTENLSYSDFKQLVAKGKVADLVLDERTINGTLTPEGLEGLLPAEKIAELQRYGEGQHRFVTGRVDDADLTGELMAANVRFTGRIQNPWSSVLLGWLLPVLFFFGLWALVMRGMHGQHAGMMAVGKSKARVYVERSTGVTFEDVAGIDEARAELMEIVDFLKNPQHYQRLGGKIPKGVLLVGEPGTGKTLLAKAVAGEAHVPFFSLSGSDFVEMFVGVGAARVRDLFAQAQGHAPSIIFIDELDALGKARGVSPVMGGHDEREQTLNQLLAEMDGFDTQKGVILMAATNRPEILDPALLRPGRFDRKVVIDRPDLHGRDKILRVHARHVTLAPDVDLGRVAARTPGFVGADLANLVNEAALGAARAGKSAIDLADFDEAIDRIVAGLERRSKVINPQEKRIVAHHEAGHALVAELRPRADRVTKISIIPRGVAALGYTMQQPTEDRYLLTRAELLDRLDVLLGGRVAEEIVFGDISTGAQDDLRRATDLARQMVTRYGMSATLGLATIEGPRMPLYLPMPGSQAPECSEETSRLIDHEVRQLLDEARTRVHHDLDTRRTTLDALGALLIEREVVDRESLDQLMAAEGGRTTVPAGTSESVAS
ncbi:MAG: ATP-dependent zinc metalloprotease FtsH [Vicinamibacterales bacterium]